MLSAAGGGVASAHLQSICSYGVVSSWACKAGGLVPVCTGLEAGLAAMDKGPFLVEKAARGLIFTHSSETFGGMALRKPCVLTMS